MNSDHLTIFAQESPNLLDPTSKKPWRWINTASGEIADADHDSRKWLSSSIFPAQIAGKANFESGVFRREARFTTDILVMSAHFYFPDSSGCYPTCLVNGFAVPFQESIVLFTGEPLVLTMVANPQSKGSTIDFFGNVLYRKILGSF